MPRLLERLARAAVVRSRSRPRPRLRAAPMVIALAIASSGCGDSSTPVTPPGPRPGGTLSGRYRLELKLGVSCGSTAVSATFPVLVTAAGVAPHPGVQVTLDGGDPGLLELELKYTSYVLEGGVGTTGDGVASDAGPQAWVSAIATGAVTQTSDGKGEVVSGTMRGYLEIEGTTACNATDHVFTLTPR